MNNVTRFHCGIEEDPPQGGTEGGTYGGTYGETQELDKRNLCVLRAGHWWTHIWASSSLLPVQEQRSRCSFEESKDLKICNAYDALHMLD